jgi:hypothetical protein
LTTYLQRSLTLLLLLLLLLFLLDRMMTALQAADQGAEEGSSSLEAAQAALQHQEELVDQASSELSPALVKYVELDQQVRRQHMLPHCSI